MDFKTLIYLNWFVIGVHQLKRHTDRIIDSEGQGHEHNGKVFFHTRSEAMNAENVITVQSDVWEGVDQSCGGWACVLALSIH